MIFVFADYHLSYWEDWNYGSTFGFLSVSEYPFLAIYSVACFSGVISISGDTRKKHSSDAASYTSALIFNE